MAFYSCISRKGLPNGSNKYINTYIDYEVQRFDLVLHQLLCPSSFVGGGSPVLGRPVRS